MNQTKPKTKSSESGNEDSSYSTRKSSSSRRYRSLSRFSHRKPDPEIEVTTPMRKGKFVNTIRGSEFGEISLDDLAVEFFNSFSGESEVSSGERGRPSFQKSGEEGDVRNSQRRGRSVSRLNADTESSRRRRSLSRKPSEIGNSGLVKVDPVNNNSNRRRSVSRQPKDKVNGDNANSRRRRSLSVARHRIDNSESDVDQVKYSSNSRDVKSFIGGKSQDSNGSRKLAGSDHRRSYGQNPIRYHDGYSSQSSAVTDDERQDSSSRKHGALRMIRTVYAQNKGTPKRRESLGNSDYGSQRKSHEDHHAISSVKKGYATKLQESEERKRDLLAEVLLEEKRGRELSMNLKELLTENSSKAEEKPLRTRKKSKDGSRRTSMCLTDEAEQFIEEFISNIEDTDFSSLEDERSESSSNFGLIKTPSSQSATVLKSVPVEMDGVMLPWLQWDTPDDNSTTLACLKNSLHTPDTKSSLWESDTTQDASSGREPSINTVSSKGSWSPYDSATKLVNPMRTLKIDVAEYLKRPNSSDTIIETWKQRHRINSGSLVLYNRSLI